MLYLNEIASYVPASRRTVAEFAQELRLASNLATVYQKVYGLQNVVIADKGIYELLDKTLDRLFSVSTVDRKKIKYIFHCHSISNICPPGVDLLTPLKKKYGLEHAIAAGASMDHCATTLTAMRYAEMLLEAEPDDAKVLVLTGEVGFHEKLRHIPNTTLAGDAASACIVGKTGERNRLVGSAHRQFDFGLTQVIGNPLPVPMVPYGDMLIRTTKDALEKASLRIEDISLILIHNVNIISWKLFTKGFPCSVDLLYADNIPRSGHCQGADPFINYGDAVREGRLKVGDYFIMTAAGTTSSFVVMIFQH